MARGPTAVARRRPPLLPQRRGLVRVTIREVVRLSPVVVVYPNLTSDDHTFHSCYPMMMMMLSPLSDVQTKGDLIVLLGETSDPN